MYASQCAIRLSVAFRLVRSDLGLIRFAIGVRLLIELTSQTSHINSSSELSINLSYWIPLYHRLFKYHSHTSTIILIFDRCTQPLSRVVIKWFRRIRSSFFWRNADLIFSQSEKLVIDCGDWYLYSHSYSYSWNCYLLRSPFVMPTTGDNIGIHTASSSSSQTPSTNEQWTQYFNNAVSQLDQRTRDLETLRT